MSINISKNKIYQEIEKISPSDYLQVIAFLKSIQKSDKTGKNSSQALKGLFSLEGCLADMKTSSIELQKKVADIWDQKYETR